MSTIIITLAIVSVILFIGNLFYKDYKIDKHGVVTIADIIESRVTGGCSNNGTEVFFVLSFIDSSTNEVKTVKVTEMVPNFYASQLQVGMQVKIKYLKEAPTKLSFIFKE